MFKCEELVEGYVLVVTTTGGCYDYGGYPVEYDGDKPGIRCGCGSFRNLESIKNDIQNSGVRFELRRTGPW